MDAVGVDVSTVENMDDSASKARLAVSASQYAVKCFRDGAVFEVFLPNSHNVDDINLA